MWEHCGVGKRRAMNVEGKEEALGQGVAAEEGGRRLDSGRVQNEGHVHGRRDGVGANLPVMV